MPFQASRHARALLLLALCAPAASQAAGSLTLTDANTKDNPVGYSAGPFFVRSAVTGCVAEVPTCDDTELIVNVSPGLAETHRVVVRTQWGEPTQADFDLYIQQGENAVTAAASTTDPEIARFRAVNGTYNIHVAAYQPYGNTFDTVAYVEPIPGTNSPPEGPRQEFHVFPAPDGMGVGGEPSVGVNWTTDVVSVGNASDTMFVTFDDSTHPAKATWVNRPAPTNIISFDPILWTDRESGHTVVSQLVSDVVNFSNGCSLSSFTIDDGLTWIPSEGCGPPAGADHQGMGGGPYHEPLRSVLAPIAFPAIYYCAQSVGVLLGDATCSRSDDGGLTYGPGIIVYTSECGGLHGHPRVAPDGTVYLPNKACVGGDDLGQGVAVSVDNGVTWSIHTVPGSTPGASDPSVATGLNDTGKQKDQPSNTVYFGFCDGDGLPKVAVSHDQGATWTNIFNVGASAGIRNCVFPEMIAGDDNRASFQFLGTTTPGLFQGEDFDGEWHAYVATTYDGGYSWGLTNATPDDPVQTGCVWMQGGGNDCRNMLDFNDIQVDRLGRPVFVFADGCTPPGCGTGSPPRKSRNALNTIGRQSGGLSLFSANDAEFSKARDSGDAGEGSGLLLGALPGSLLLGLVGLLALRRRR